MSFGGRATFSGNVNVDVLYRQQIIVIIHLTIQYNLMNDISRIPSVKKPVQCHGRGQKLQSNFSHGFCHVR